MRAETPPPASRLRLPKVHARRADRGAVHPVVVLVEPQYAGNVGHVARSMMNFGATELLLVRPSELGPDARQRAVHAQRVLDEARTFATFADAAREVDLTVAFAARAFPGDRSHLRNPVSLVDLAPLVAPVAGRVGLVFGREDDGLSNEDVLACDLVCTIPTSPMYRSMNLSHAVTVALYELARGAHPVRREPPASTREKEILFRAFDHVLSTVYLPEHRVEPTRTMFRRLVGRAALTRWEYHRMMGAIAAILKAQKAWPVPGIAELPDDEPS
jgi:TrmH family RNA methyltransferase